MPEPSPPSARDELRLIVEAAQLGDAAATDRLLQQHLPGLRAFVRLHVGPELRERESCSDIVQSVCREVLSHLGRFEYRGEASFRNWLLSSALNKIVDRQRYWLAERRRANREAVLSSQDDESLSACYATFCTPSHHAAARERIAQIEAAFEKLPEQYREVIVQSRIVGLSHVEIAERTGRTPGAIKTMLNRALVRLSGLVDAMEHRAE